MSKSNAFENEILEHILNNAGIALIGDATGLRGSTTPGSLYLALHTADPGEGGDQTTNEIAYTSYARKAVARDGAQWIVTNNQAVNANEEAFPQCTGGSGTATHVSIGTAASGTGKLLYLEALNSPLAISNLITPRFPAGQITITEE